ncbi:hypothetical protein [Halobacteriovorax sp. JY17]|uniref:hypothetical protein n=1 Tax=Halobacteriovorax sp. JY17 TaxID=2014617 RepID=UPI0025C51313|nr:hypothetical protein [Halobacteriovorax sp. JY17]
MTKIYGFTFMRGVDRLDYPYMEMLESMGNLTEKIYLALGDSDDNTGKNVRTLPNVEVIDTTWEDKYMGDGGKIFSQQANVALDRLREVHGEEDDAWALFLHCDEIIHPAEYQQLQEDLKKAIAEGADAIRLRFLHFWKDHYHIAANKRWQPAEIRLFKLKSPIVCYGDAQGFDKFTKQIDSDVNLFHYGHVRPAEQHKLKQEEIMRRIRPAEKFNKYWNREKKAFAKTKMLTIFCKHPEFMRDRIERLGDNFDLPEKEELHIVGNKKNYSTKFLNSLNVKSITWHDSRETVPKNKRKKDMIIVRPSFGEQIIFKQPKSVKMESPLAKEWSPEMELLFRISEKDCSQKEIK